MAWLVGNSSLLNKSCLNENSFGPMEEVDSVVGEGIQACSGLKAASLERKAALSFSETCCLA